MGGTAFVHCFKYIDDYIMQSSTCEDEIVEIFKIVDIWDKQLIDHLHFLIPMAMNPTVGYSHIRINTL